LNNLRDVTERFQLSTILETMKVILRAPLRRAELVLVNESEVRFNKNVLVKVFYNLILNSVEAAPPSTRLRIEIDGNAATGTVYVRDNGPGFPPAALKALNSGKLVKSSKSNSGSIGTHLIIHLIESKGGHIRFANRPEGGAEISIRFPVVALAPKEAPAPMLKAG
jgi:signal transduction histidine kinase